MTPPATPKPPERPGWMALALILLFVLGGVLLYVVGAHMVTSTR